MCEPRCCFIPRWVAPRPALLSSQGAWANNSAILPQLSARGPTCACKAVLIFVLTLCASWIELVALSSLSSCWVKLPPIGWNWGVSEVEWVGHLDSDIFCWAHIWVCGAAARSWCKFCHCNSYVAKICMFCLLDCTGPRTVQVCPCSSPKGWSWADQEAHAAGTSFSLGAFCRDSLRCRECCSAEGTLCMECVSESA